MYYSLRGLKSLYTQQMQAIFYSYGRIGNLSRTAAQTALKYSIRFGPGLSLGHPQYSVKAGTYKAKISAAFQLLSLLDQ
jgi:hypothetical protein